MRKNVADRQSARSLRSTGVVYAVGANLLWAFYAVLSVAAIDAPAFLVLAIAFTSLSAVLVLRRMVLGERLGDMLRLPSKTLSLGFVGLFGANALYNVSLRKGVDPVSATIVMHLWPVLMILVVLAFRLARITHWDLGALALGFAGVTVIALKDGGFSLHVGLVLSFLGALAWATYSALRPLVEAGPRDALGGFAVLSAGASWILHLVAGEPTSIDLETLLVAIAVGVLPMGLGNVFWDVGTRTGDPLVMAGVSFLEPAASVILLALVLSLPVAGADVIGITCVLAGIFLSLVGERSRRSQGFR